MSLRLAFFSPLPPAPSGIADYAADLLPMLPGAWTVDVYLPDDAEDPDEPPPRGQALCHEAWRAENARHPYDLNVYHVGNNVLHAYALHHVVETPGLLVLHDPVLHPARAAAHLRAGDAVGYRTAALAARPDVGATLAELVLGGLGGPDLHWTFPLCEDLVRASRLTVVHGAGTAAWLSALIPDAAVGEVVHWRAVPPVDDDRLDAWRQRLGVGEGTPLIGTFGHIGPAHGVELLVDVLGELAHDHAFRLAIVGAVDPSLELADRVAAAGLEARVSLTGRVPAADFAALMRITDLAVNLRYPTARASSGTLQQLMQLDIPVIVHDLVHTRDMPEDAAPRVPPGPREVERRVLKERLRNWLADPQARRRASAACAAWASRTITPEAMAASYRAAILQATQARR